MSAEYWHDLRWRNKEINRHLEYMRAHLQNLVSTDNRYMNVYIAQMELNKLADQLLRVQRIVQEDGEFRKGVSADEITDSEAIRIAKKAGW